MKKILFIIPVLFAVAISLCSCEENPLPSENKTEVKGISVQTTSIPSLFVGDTQEIKYTLNPSNANTAYLNWVSTDVNKATVSSGFVTGVAEGDAEIRIYLMDSVDDRVAKIVDTLAKIPVHVDNVLAEMAAIYNNKVSDLTALSVFKNKTTEAIYFGVRPLNTTIKTAKWTTSDKAKALFQVTVKDKDGKPVQTKDKKDSIIFVETTKATDVIIKALAPGTVIIKAETEDGSGKSASFTLTIENVDDLSVLTPDAAGSRSIIGGDNPDIKAEGTHFLSYSKGMVSWTENTTGSARTDTLEIPATSSRIIVTQAEPKDFKGTWDFRTQRFSNNTNVTTTAADITIPITIGDPLVGETLTDFDGTSYTNNLGVKGLYLDAVADAVAVFDYESGKVKFGIFLDERKAQAVVNGNTTYPYVCFIPECGTTWNAGAMSSPWNFVPKPISATQNYQWLWFDVKEDLKTLQYDHPYKQNLIGKDGSNGTTIIGITCAVAKNATPTADDIYGTYNVIYQANPGKKNDVGGFMLTKK